MPSDSQAFVVKDIKQTRRRLKQFAPEVLKELDKTNRKLAKPLLDKAKGTVPPDSVQLKNWVAGGRYKWDSAEVKKGIKFKADKRKRGQRYSAILGFMNESAAGSIFELAGYSDSSSNFAQELNARFGKAPRLIWRALDKAALVSLRNQIYRNYVEAEKSLNEELKKKRVS